MAEQDATVEILKDIRDEIRSARNELRDEIRGVRTERIEPDDGRKGRAVLVAVAVGAAVLVVGLFAFRDRGNGGNAVTKDVAQRVAAETVTRPPAAPIADRRGPALPDPPMPVRAVSPEIPMAGAAKPAPLVALHPAAVAAPTRVATRRRAPRPPATDLEPAKL